MIKIRENPLYPRILPVTSSREIRDAKFFKIKIS